MAQLMKNVYRIAFGLAVLAAIAFVLFAPGVIWFTLWPETVPSAGFGGEATMGDAVVQSWIVMLVAWFGIVGAWYIGKSFIA